MKKNNHYRNFFPNEEEAEIRKKIFDQIYEKKLDTWDFQWVFAKIINRGLSIVPKKNLIVNIGFGSDATHTKFKPLRFKKLNRNKIDFPLTHPQFILTDKKIEQEYFKKNIKQNPLKIILKKIWKKSP